MQTGNAEILAAAGFQPEQEGEHGAQFFTDLMLLGALLSVAGISVEEVPDRKRVRQIEVAAISELCDHPAQGQDIF